MTSDERLQRLAGRVIDLVVYAPIGAIDMLRHEAPRRVDDGRRQVGQRVRTARWIGEMAVTVGRQKISQRWAARTAPTTAPSVTAEASAATASASANSMTPAPVEPFHGYDALPASELVQLLFRLSPGELDLVRTYEAATRGRRTVLAKVDQLRQAT